MQKNKPISPRHTQNKNIEKMTDVPETQSSKALNPQPDVDEGRGGEVKIQNRFPRLVDISPSLFAFCFLHLICAIVKVGNFVAIYLILSSFIYEVIPHFPAFLDRDHKIMARIYFGVYAPCTLSLMGLSRGVSPFPLFVGLLPFVYSFVAFRNRNVLPKGEGKIVIKPQSCFPPLIALLF